MHKFVGYLFLFIFSFDSIASGSRCRQVMEDLNNTVVNIISSGRDEKVLEKLKNDTVDLTNIAHKLGFNVPDHNLLFASSEVLSQLVGVGGYAAPYWAHGLRVLQASRTLAGVMEFVVNGSKNSHAFYKDTTKYIHQLSIIMHVIGHNDFANTSIYATSRGGDGIAASYEISKLMQKLYQNYDHDSVSLFYQALESFWTLQDMVSGSHQPREQFVKNPIETEELFGSNSHTGEVEDFLGLKKTNIPGVPKLSNTKHPASPTSSMLQAMVSNLPKDADKWKVKLAELFEENYRSQPELSATQVVNEGWATFSMYLIAKHSKFISTKDQIDFAGLLSGVSVPSLTNPYWLGLECFWNLYWKFRERPEIKVLDDLEKDDKFVEFAHDIIKTHSSSQFIRRSLDKKWVEKRKLQLMRDATPEEVEAAGLDPNKPHHLVLSRDHERIINYIARKAADQSEKYVRVSLNDLNFKDHGVFIKQDESVKIPVEKFSAAQTLFLLTRYFMKPVTFDAFFAKSDVVKQEVDDGWGFKGQSEKRVDSIAPVRIVVDPDGSAIVYTRGAHESGKEVLEFDQKLTMEAMGAIEYYKKDISISYKDDLITSQTLSHSKAVLAIKDYVTGKGGLDVINHASTASEAISELYEMLDTRAAKKIQQLLSGKVSAKLSSSGIRLPLLPMIPRIQFDQRALKAYNASKPLGPIDSMINPFQKYPANADDNSVLGGGHGVPGDMQEKPPQGQGEGEGDGEPQPSKEKSDEENYDGGAEDPSELVIPLELWGKILGEKYELPNRRKTPDGSDNPIMRRSGIYSNDRDPLRVDETVENAIMWGLAIERKRAIEAAKAKGEKYTEDKSDKRELLKRAIKTGFKYMPPEEFKMKPLKPKPNPEFKAVVVIVLDLTGSVFWDHKGVVPQEVAKNLMYNIVALLKAKYTEIELRFVGYDWDAHEFPEKKIWHTVLGGGNKDSTGYIKAKEILDEYPNSSWNKYVYGTGDGGSTDTSETIKAMEEIYEDVQHMAFIANRVNPSWGSEGEGSFLGTIKQFAAKHEWFDYTSINHERGTLMKALDDLFSKTKK